VIIIVPNVLRDAINKKLDEVLSEFPEAEKDRELFYHKLLEYFDEHGEIPDFTLTKKVPTGR
jgi:hypothetical protein